MRGCATTAGGGVGCKDARGVGLGIGFGLGGVGAGDGEGAKLLLGVADPDGELPVVRGVAAPRGLDAPESLGDWSFARRFIRICGTGYT